MRRVDLMRPSILFWIVLLQVTQTEVNQFGKIQFTK